eukprot:TRINITY_DN5100_c0_g1_i1.p1 TRINITY_DN5100_c0_g1~~TRINITY_DN5100_c0_g1_i1.p1  ORF type:complete len:737 (+),score=276.36 TRINITY_DN5100_c0_g1_i1:113-2323(+)
MFQTEEIDPLYEFIDAPKQINFQEMVNGSRPSTEKWFDAHDEEAAMREAVNRHRKSLAKDAEISQFIERELMEEKREEEMMREEQVSSEGETYHEESNPHAYLQRTMGRSEAASEMGEDRQSELNSMTKNTFYFRPTVPRSPRFATTARLGRKQREESQHNSTTQSKRELGWTGQLTVPQGPSFYTDDRLANKRPRVVETSEQQELRRLQEEINELQERKEMHKRLMDKAVHGPSFLPTRSTSSVTYPTEFSFATDARLGPKTKEEEEEFIPNKRVRRDGELTVAQPFSFASDARLTSKSTWVPPTSVQPFVSFEQQINNFHKRTPEKIRKQRRNRERVAERAKREAGGPTITQPQPFRFEVDERLICKPKEKILSTQEREEQEALNAPKFKARPFDKKIIESAGVIGLKRVERPAPTEPTGFSFATDSRLRNLVADHQQQSNEFFANNESMMSTQNTSASRKRPLLPTRPQSPLLQTKQRSFLQTMSSSSKPAEKTFQFKAKPIPQVAPFVPQKSSLSVTQFEEFDLNTEVRGKTHQEIRREQLEEERRKEEEQRNFKARGMLVVDEPFRPHRVPQVTDAKPFHLHTEERGTIAQQSFGETLQKENLENHKKRQFKAKPFSNTHWEPAKIQKPLLEMKEFNLNSESRAFQRKQFEDSKAQKEIEYEHAKKMAEQAKAEQLEKEIAEYRRTLIHRAAPVHKFKPLVIKASENVLTAPKSPLLNTKSRGLLHTLRGI